MNESQSKGNDMKKPVTGQSVKIERKPSQNEENHHLWVPEMDVNIGEIVLVDDVDSDDNTFTIYGDHRWYPNCCLEKASGDSGKTVNSCTTESANKVDSALGKLSDSEEYKKGCADFCRTILCKIEDDVLDNEAKLIELKKIVAVMEKVMEPVKKIRKSTKQKVGKK